MKKSLAFIAAFAALVSCNKVEGTLENKTVNVAVDAALPEAIKAQFGTLTAGVYPMVWTDSETALLVEFADGAKKELGYTSYTKTSDTKASFGFALPEKSASSYDYYVTTPYAGTTVCGARTGGTPPSGFEGAISYALLHAANVQTPLADAPDPATHIMIASQKGLSAQPEKLSLSFNSVVSYGKMKVTGFPALATGETVSKIVITAPSGTIMRGRLWRNPDGSLMEYSTGAQSNFVNVDPKNITFNTTGFDVWFTTFPFALGKDDKLDVTVTTSVNNYTASITLSKALAFEEGKVSSFTYNWTKGQPEPGGDKVLTFDFSGASLEGWPTAQGAAEEHRDVVCVYPLGGVNYSFHLFEAPGSKGGKIYWNGSNGYFTFGAPYRYMGLPIIENYALKTVECTVGKKIASTASYITDEIGGITTSTHPNPVCAAQAWNVAVGTVIKYEVNATDPTKQYYLYCKSTSAAMAKLVLTYSPVEE